jgi:hypothetical protein
VEPPAPHPTRKLAIENERLRVRIEALERLAAESREAEEARRESEERSDVVGAALRESGSDAMVFRYWSGVHGTNNASLRVGQGTGLAAQVLETRRAARTTRYASDQRIGRDYAEVADRETIVTLAT